MYLQSLYVILSRPKHHNDNKKEYPYIVIGGLMVVLYAFAFSSDALYGQLMWIEHRDFPGGPVAYFIANSSIWDQDLGTTAAMVTNWLGDGLLV